MEKVAVLIPCYNEASQIYHTAIGTALMLTMVGLCFWLSSVRYYGEGEKKRFLAYGMTGSLVMALAVGARPRFAMASFLAFAIFFDLFKDIKKNWGNIALLIIPYVPVAGFLMWYNYARFGSAIAFGIGTITAQYEGLDYNWTSVYLLVKTVIGNCW